MLRRAGARVTAIAPPESSLAHSWLVERHIAAPASLDDGVDLIGRELAGRAYDLVVIADEATLFAVTATDASWAASVLPFVPAAKDLILDKNRLLERMDAAGVAIPPFAVVRAGEHPAAMAARIGYPLVLKDATGCGGATVRRVDRADALADAWTSLRPAGDFTVQRFLEARSGCTDVLFDHGVPRIWTSAYMRDQWPSPFDPATVRHPVARPEVAAMLHAVGSATGFHGFGGVDWIETADGAIWFLEFNARVTHVVGPARPAFGAELGRMLRGEPVNPRELVLPDAPIPIFPSHFVRALKTRPTDLLQWLPLRRTSADLDWRDAGIIATELGDLARGAAHRLSARLSRSALPASRASNHPT